MERLGQDFNEKVIPIKMRTLCLHVAWAGFLHVERFTQLRDPKQGQTFCAAQADEQTFDRVWCGLIVQQFGHLQTGMNELSCATIRLCIRLKLVWTRLWTAVSRHQFLIYYHDVRIFLSKCHTHVKLQIKIRIVWVHSAVYWWDPMYQYNDRLTQLFTKYSGPSSYDRLDIRTTWVTTKILVLTYDQILSYDPHGVRKLQSEPIYACLWT
jgi:hypothetical protein